MHSFCFCHKAYVWWYILFLFPAYGGGSQTYLMAPFRTYYAIRIPHQLQPFSVPQLCLQNSWYPVLYIETAPGFKALWVAGYVSNRYVVGSLILSCSAIGKPVGLHRIQCKGTDWQLGIKALSSPCPCCAAATPSSSDRNYYSVTLPFDQYIKKSCMRWLSGEGGEVRYKTKWQKRHWQREKKGWWKNYPTFQSGCCWDNRKVARW